MWLAEIPQSKEVIIKGILSNIIQQGGEKKMYKIKYIVPKHDRKFEDFRKTKKEIKIMAKKIIENLKGTILKIEKLTQKW